MRWTVGVNEPGCLPVVEPPIFDTWERAWHYLVDQMEWASMNHGPAGAEYDSAREQALMLRENTSFSVFCLGNVWWLSNV